VSGTSLLASGLAVLLAYLIGAIPFGFLIFYQVKGIDVRTVGSGNIGATNVGRNLGFRYFILVFLLDMLKGFLPTLYLPRGVAALAGTVPADLPVFVALAAILGHNFPIYLKFRGGKGVATSLGAVLALDPTATLAAVLGFAVVMSVTSYVSLSSIMGGFSFAAAHFLSVKEPWSVEHRGVSFLTVALLVLLIVRHRKNLQRIINGAEPKVMLFKSKGKTPPNGCMATVLLYSLIPISLLIVGGVWVARNAMAPVEVLAGAWTFREVDRVSTGLQRADRVQFSDDGKLLAVTCPRYNKLAIYRVEPAGKLDLIAEVELDGRPVGLAAGLDRFLVLQRPPGDRCHLEPGWFEVIDGDGKRVGPKVLAGDYPDDLALAPDRKTLYVLSSGRGEGGPNTHLPRLDVFEVSPAFDVFTPGDHVDFKSVDDPLRLQISRHGGCAVVSLRGRKAAPSFDLSDPKRPRLIGESTLPGSGKSELSNSPIDGDSIILPVETESEAVVISLLGRGSRGDDHPFLACTNPDESTVEITQPLRREVIARFPLRGRFNLGRSHPGGIAYARDKHLIAVAGRSGAIHLIAIDSNLDEVALSNNGSDDTR
jgi:glycerol-3-phosphate acyltransferase PlsY